MTPISSSLAKAATVVAVIRARFPLAMAVYAFGSQVNGSDGADSDLDLAVLLPGYADPEVMWDLAGNLADLVACPVDLLDLRAASTVMQYQVITSGQRLWSVGLPGDLFELLAHANWIEASLADALKRMVAFRNIAVHDYQALLLPITVKVITEHLHEFLVFSAAVLKRDGATVK